MDDRQIRAAVEMVRERALERSLNRREAILKALGSGAVIAAGMALPALALPKAAQAQAVTDADILNFALNFEYLESEYYTLGTTGQTIEQLGIPTGGAGTTGGINVRANPQVPFTNQAVREFLEEVALDERTHVQAVRSLLGGAAVARPPIDYTGAFNAAAQAAGIGPAFDPFASEVNFLIGGLTFSDVTITALKGASPLIQSRDILDSAAGLLGTEGYHVGGLRLRIYNAGPTAQDQFQRVSDLRDTLDDPATDKDQGVVDGSRTNVVATDGNAIAFSRSFSEVLRIVYQSSAPGVSSGGFFPSGVNGSIRAAA